MKGGAFLLVAAVVLGGCGDGAARLSKSQYEAKLQSAFSAANGELSPAPRAAGSISLLKRIGSAYGDIATALRGQKAPLDVEPLNRKLATAASARSAALKALVARLEAAPAGNRRRLLAQYDAARFGEDDFDAAVAALEEKGYKFRPSAGT